MARLVQHLTQHVPAALHPTTSGRTFCLDLRFMLLPPCMDLPIAISAVIYTTAAHLLFPLSSLLLHGLWAGVMR